MNYDLAPRSIPPGGPHHVAFAGGKTYVNGRKVRGNSSNSVTEPTKWGDRKVTPAHFLAVLAVCGIFGFAASLGACQFVASVIAKRAQAALGDAFNLD